MTSGWIFWVAGDTKLLYLLNCRFLFCLSNVLFAFCRYQLGGSFLLGVGVWVLVDPTGFREIVATNPLLFTGVYIILGMGGMLFLLGFLGCCGAIRENKCLLLFVSWLTKSKHSCVTARSCVCVCVLIILSVSLETESQKSKMLLYAVFVLSEVSTTKMRFFTFLSFSFLNTWTCTFLSSLSSTLSYSFWPFPFSFCLTAVLHAHPPDLLSRAGCCHPSLHIPGACKFLKKFTPPLITSLQLGWVSKRKGSDSYFLYFRTWQLLI